MKNLKLLLVFSSILFAIPKSNAQSIVTDPTLTAVTEANWATQLEQSVQQFQEMITQSTLMKETISRYKKVNRLIKNGQQIIEITDMQVQIVALISSSIKSAEGNVQSLRAYKAYVLRMKSLASISLRNIKRLNEILTDSALELSDYERIKMIDELKRDTNNLYSTVKGERNKYNKLNRAIKEISTVSNAQVK